MDGVEYRKAGIEDLDDLVEFRIRFLNDYKDHPRDGETEILRKNIKDYLEKEIPREKFVAFIAETDGEVVASSGMEVRDVAPRYGALLKGRMGYIMNMYTLPDLRNRGIATRLLHMLIEEAKRLDVGLVHLHASKDGSGIYEEAGFVPADLPEINLDLVKVINN
jgi:GNAT superfamily N-acetyltransferase